MFKFLKRCRCKHEYTKIKSTVTERVVFDRITTTYITYTCRHCNHTFKVIDSVVSTPIEHISKALSYMNQDTEKKRKIGQLDLKVIKNPLKTGCPIKNK